MKKYWENTLGQTGIIVFFITCLILLGISFFYNWLYIVSIPLTLFFIYSFNKDYSETMERVRRNEKYYEKEKSKSEEDGIDKFKGSIEIFIEKMKEIPDWYRIIQTRGNGHAMMVNAGIKADNYEYWGNAHKDEYIMKYKESNLDVEGIKLRIEKFRLITTELEKVIKIASKLNLNVTTEMANDYHAARASVLGAEKALKEMTS